MTGVKTNTITAVIIAGRDAHDSPMFKPLVEATAEHFTVKEVPADKAYLSRESLDLLHTMGGTAFVPFKSNSTAGEPGSLWERMFHYYQFRRDEFLKHYHQRSNVESTFSMVKAKFRDHVRSKTDVAMTNKVTLQVPLPQPLRADSVSVRDGNRAGLLASGAAGDGRRPGRAADEPTRLRKGGHERRASSCWYVSAGGPGGSRQRYVHHHEWAGDRRCGSADVAR